MYKRTRAYICAYDMKCLDCFDSIRGGFFSRAQI